MACTRRNRSEGGVLHPCSVAYVDVAPGLLTEKGKGPCTRGPFLSASSVKQNVARSALVVRFRDHEAYHCAFIFMAPASRKAVSTRSALCASQSTDTSTGPAS